MSKNTIAIENTHFIFQTNFSGDPSRERFGDARRKANLIIPDPQQAKDLMIAGYKVRETKPRPDDDPDTFQPEYFIPVFCKYRNKLGEPVKYPPKVYLVVGNNEPVLLDEDSVGMIDQIRVKNVNIILNQYEYDPVNHAMNLYVRTMYVEQDLDDDPYAARYRRTEEKPF